MNSIHSFDVELINGELISLSTYKGKKLLIVNVASECGYTPQYEGLQELYNMFSDKLVVLACPCNDFGGQEPGTGEEIQTFCSTNFGVRFPMLSKVGIVNDTHPMYTWLTSKSENGKLDAEVNWNFCKFLLDEDGQLEHFYNSNVAPASEEIANWLNK